MFKNILKYAILTLAFWAPTRAAASRLVLPLTPGPQATLADIFSSQIGEKTVFHFPNTPHFRHWYDFTAPRQYNAFYTSKAGSISLGGFVRFIEKGKSLFKNLTDRARYEAAMDGALKAHKDYQARPSTKRYVALHAAEVEVLTRLEQVPLTSEINHELCIMLSTPDSSFFSRLLSRFILPFRSHFVRNEDNPAAGIISRGHLLLETPCYGWGAFTLGLLISPIMATTFSLIALLTGSAIKAYTSLHPFKAQLQMTFPLGVTALSQRIGTGAFYALWGVSRVLAHTHDLLYFTNYKLAPEPTDGVTVIILDSSEAIEKIQVIQPQMPLVTEEIKQLKAPLTLTN